MRREKGVTMLGLVLSIMILLLLAAVTLSYAIGRKGGLVLASEESFRYDMQQIKELVDLKQTEYDLNEERYATAFTRNMEAQILEAYANRMTIKATYVKEQKRLILTVFFDPESFTPEQRAIMLELRIC